MAGSNCQGCLSPWQANIPTLEATESTTLGQPHITSQLPHATINSWINESMTKKIWECKKEIARGKILHHPSKFHNIGTSSSKTSIESTTALALGSTWQVMTSLVARFVWGTILLKRRRLQPGQTLPAQAQPPPGETFMGMMGQWQWQCLKKNTERERVREGERRKKKMDVKKALTTCTSANYAAVKEPCRSCHSRSLIGFVPFRGTELGSSKRMGV